MQQLSDIAHGSSKGRAVDIMHEERDSLTVPGSERIVGEKPKEATTMRL